jgi:hypothetical protein
MLDNKLALAAAGIALAALSAGPVQAQKLTVSCEEGSLAAYDKGADKPYELLQVKKFVLKVDVDAKTCAVESAEAVYLKGKAQPQALKSDPEAAKCTLRVTDKGRAFMNGRSHLSGDKGAVTPILTINYEVLKAPPAAGSAEAKGEYFIISGFPSVKAKGGKIDSRIKANCAQSKPAS